MNALDRYLFDLVGGEVAELYVGDLRGSRSSEAGHGSHYLGHQWPEEVLRDSRTGNE